MSGEEAYEHIREMHQSEKAHLMHLLLTDEAISKIEGGHDVQIIVMALGHYLGEMCGFIIETLADLAGSTESHLVREAWMKAMREASVFHGLIIDMTEDGML